LLLAVGSTIYTLSYDATRFGATDIVPEYRSKEIKHSDGLIAPYAFEVRYESDSDLTLNVYLDGVLHTTRTLSSASTEEYQLLPAATPCNRIQWGVTLSAAQAASNTSVEIRSFTLSYKPVVRV